MFRQRLRFVFAKEGRLRFISHHDLMRLFERALRRSGLPLRFSEGYNPRPQVSFPAALALGAESVAEIAEVELVAWVSPSMAGPRLQGEMPEGLRIVSVQSVRHGEKAEVVGARYSVRLGAVPADFVNRVKRFMDAATAVVKRNAKAGVKEINVRGFVRDVQLDGDMLKMDLGVSPAGSVRPEEVLEAILEGPSDALAPLSITRTSLDLSPPS